MWWLNQIEEVPQKVNTAHINRIGYADMVKTNKDNVNVSLGVDEGCLKIFTENGAPLSGIKEINITGSCDDVTIVDVTFLIKGEVK